MSMHPSVARAFEEIDAAMFSGNTFMFPENLAVLEKYLGRWNRTLPSLQESVSDEDEEE